MLEDGRVMDVANVIWCTGFRQDFSWIDVPVFGEDSEPVQQRGVASEPGLYFVGLDFLYSFTSENVGGVGTRRARTSPGTSRPEPTSLRVARAGPPRPDRERDDRPRTDHESRCGNRYRHWRAALEESGGCNAVGCGAEECFTERSERLDLEQHRRGDDLPAEDDPDRCSTRSDRGGNPEREHQSERGHEAEPGRRTDEDACAGRAEYPANTIDPVAVIAKPAPTIGKRSMRPAGMRAANRASRERPVTTSSRKTPEPRSPLPESPRRGSPRRR